MEGHNGHDEASMSRTQDELLARLTEVIRRELDPMSSGPRIAPDTIARAVLNELLPSVRVALSDAERTMLRYALNEAQEHIWSRDGFTDEDQAALDSLRRMADEEPIKAHPPRDSWLVEWREGKGDWAVAYPTHDRSKALDRLERGRREVPNWQWRLVRETASYRVEETDEIHVVADSSDDRPGCPDPVECDHEAALGLAEEKLDQVRAVAEAWARPTMSAPTRRAGLHLLRLLAQLPVSSGLPEPHADDYEQTTGHLVTCLAVMGSTPDPSCGCAADTGKEPDEQPCNAAKMAQLGSPLVAHHGPHLWEVQPGGDLVRCPGTGEQPDEPR